MLSVVLYGRNDSHGYNLHKRAAISLNAIAELLTDPDDEILFVDYNTPDDLPTFVEAIADTLSEKAVDRIRVLRVRPWVHRERFAARTHLVALEPIARNVAARRSNPANRWVLSTNTDMIFCPRKAGETLSAIAAGLPDGFYHLPRFELPEGLWETLDRKDGPGIIAAAREWGRRYHLNEIVYSGADNVYDGPGDFQLFLREDLFAIGGFHEEMIRGWHLDANIARRMRILRGQVSSALDHLVGYHCDHTRLASPYHKADRQENDPVRFVDNVFEAPIPEQMENWGLAEVDIEEFRLGNASAARYLAGLEKVVHSPFEGFMEARYAPEAFGNLGYTVEHVLPYLLDLVSCTPQSTAIGYVGARADLFAGFAQGWAAMGADRPIRIPDCAPWLARDVGVPAEVLPMAEWLARSDMFIFEIGAETASNQADLSAEERHRLWTVDDAFKSAAACDNERQIAGRAARRAFVVNGVHNFFEPETFRFMAPTLTPYSSRIRHGYFADRVRNRVATASPVQARMRSLLSTFEPPPAPEIEQLKQLISTLAAPQARETDWTGAAQVGAEIAALAKAAPDLPHGLHGAVERLGERRVSRRVPGAMVSSEAGRNAASRLIRVEDWDEPEWAALASRLYSNVEHGSLLRREEWMWERVSMTQNLLRDIGKGGAVLLVGALPEAHAFALAQLRFDVDIASPASLIEGRLDGDDWREQYAHNGWLLPDSVKLAQDRAAAIADGFRYDAVLILQNGVFIEGRPKAAALLRQAAALLRPGGHFGFSARVQLTPGAGASDHALSFSLVNEGRLAQAIATLTELELSGELDDRITPRTLDRMSGPDRPVVPPLVSGPVERAEALSVFSFRRGTALAREPDWAGVRALFFGGAPGSGKPAARPNPFLKLLRPTALAPSADQARFGRLMDHVVAAREGTIERRPTGLAVHAEPGELAFQVGVGRLTPGGYTMVLETYVRRAPAGGPLMALGLVGDDGPIAVQSVTAAPGPRRIDFRFEVPREAVVQDLQLQVRVLDGQFDLVDLCLR